jgi:hypothetical protein
VIVARLHLGAIGCVMDSGDLSGLHLVLAGDEQLVSGLVTTRGCQR